MKYQEIATFWDTNGIIHGFSDYEYEFEVHKLWCMTNNEKLDFTPEDFRLYIRDKKDDLVPFKEYYTEFARFFCDDLGNDFQIMKTGGIETDYTEYELYSDWTGVITRFSPECVFTTDLLGPDATCKEIYDLWGKYRNGDL